MTTQTSNNNLPQGIPVKVTDYNKSKEGDECFTSDSDDDDEDLMSLQSVRQETTNQQVVESPTKREKLTLKCPFEGCKKVFHKTRYLEDHERSHTGERPFTCTFRGCYKSYTKKEHLKRHQRSHDPGTPKFSCPHCNQTYSLKANLTRHINRTHDDTRFECTVTDCNESFKKNFQLKRHMSKTHGVKPFVCSYEDCKKEFSQKQHLNHHMKTHKGYNCTYEGCDTHCETWSLMRKHVATSHSLEHTCQECGKTFPNAQYKAHIKQHKKQRESFLCSYPGCHKAYFDKRNLNTHVRVCHEAAKFECSHEGCQAKLVSKQKLQEHLSKVHNPIYMRKQKLRQKKKRKIRMEKLRKGKAVKEMMGILLRKTEMKICATSRREFEGREGGAPDREVALQVINEPGRPKLMDIVSADNDKEMSDQTSEHETKSSGLGVSLSESDNLLDSDEISDDMSDVSDDIADDVSETSDSSQAFESSDCEFEEFEMTSPAKNTLDTALRTVNDSFDDIETSEND